MIQKLHQIWITDNATQPSEYVTAQMTRLKNMYSDWEYILYDNDSCRELIKSEFGQKSVILYDSLIPYAFRADLARYCILYKYGGQYFDAVLNPEFKLDIECNALIYRSAADACDGFSGIDNGVMIFNTTHHLFLSDAIERCLKNIRKQDYGAHALSITGPVMLGSLNEYDVVFGQTKWINRNQKASFLGEKLHWMHRPVGTYLYTLGCEGTNSYEELYHARQVFSNNKNLKTK
jgi:mannosyltransferase OCH1-like enzyme